MPDDPRTDLVRRIEAARQRWHALAADVGEDRMELPGAMGPWTFKDVTSHLTAWRRRTVQRVEAAGRDEPPPPPPWEADLGPAELEDDTINDWIHERTADLPPSEALAGVDPVFDAFAAAVMTVPPDAATEPGRFAWLGGEALVDLDPSGHLAEHEPGVRQWLARLDGSGTTPSS